jgi:hypothetical protein
MAKGHELATWSVKTTSLTYSGGGAVISANVEGTGTGGLGALLGTAVFVNCPKGGPLSYSGLAYQENGEVLLTSGTGAFESIGGHRWKTSAILELSDGRRMLSEGEIELANRSWSGKVYEWK